MANIFSQTFTQSGIDHILEVRIAHFKPDTTGKTPDQIKAEALNHFEQQLGFKITVVEEENGPESNDEWEGEL